MPSLVTHFAGTASAGTSDPHCPCKGSCCWPCRDTPAPKSPAGARGPQTHRQPQSPFSPGSCRAAPHGPGPKDTAWLHHHGTSSSQRCYSTQTHKNTLEKSGGDGGKEGQGTSETPGEIDPDLGEKTRHGSILRAGALLLKPTPKHDNSPPSFPDNKGVCSAEEGDWQGAPFPPLHLHLSNLHAGCGG